MTGAIPRASELLKTYDILLSEEEGCFTCAPVVQICGFIGNMIQSYTSQFRLLYSLHRETFTFQWVCRPAGIVAERFLTRNGVNLVILLSLYVEDTVCISPDQLNIALALLQSTLES